MRSIEPRPDRERRDRGSVLPIVLVVSVVLSVVVVGIATYTTATLRYGQVVEDSAQRLGAAQGGMDFALGRLDRVSTLCVTEAAASPGGVPINFDTDVNGLRAEITCRLVNQGATSAQSFAIVVTGERTGTILSIEQGGGNPNAKKKIEGPIFISRDFTANSNLVNMQADLVHTDGDLIYTRATCPSDDHITGLKPQGPPGTWFFDDDPPPARNTSRCTTKNWNDLFLADRPAQPTQGVLDSFPARASTTPPANPSGCRVWEPGRYTAAPSLGTNNYFKSGEYFFHNIGTWNISSWVLAGAPRAGDPSIVTVNHPCRSAWEADRAAGETGAVFIMGGNSRINVANSSGSSLEISPRLRDRVFLSVLALESPHPYASSIPNEDALLSSATGQNSQLAIKGLVWAPYKSLSFLNTTNGAIGQLSGGAVVAGARLGAPGTAPPSLVIQVPTIDDNTTIEVTSVARNSGETAVQAILDYRPSDGAIGIRSRRVMGLTPGDPVPSGG